MLGFVLFGTISLVLSIVVFPLFWIIVRNPTSRSRISRDLVSICFGLCIQVVNRLGVLRYNIIGDEKIEGLSGCLILANHPSLIDAIFLLSIFRDANVVAKHSLFSNAFTMIAVRVLNYISNRDPSFMMAECIQRLKAGQNLVLFPEGTRSVPGQPLCFSRGAATIAIRARSSCLPVSIQCVPPLLTKTMPWYRIPKKRVSFIVEVHDLIDIRQFVENLPNEKMASIALNDCLRDVLSQATVANVPNNLG